MEEKVLIGEVYRIVNIIINQKKIIGKEFYFVLFIATGLIFLVLCGGGGVGSGEFVVDTTLAFFGNPIF